LALNRGYNLSGTFPNEYPSEGEIEMSTKDKPSREEQAVIAALGSSGQKVVDFVHVTIADKMKANAEELRDAVARFNEYVETAEAKEGGNTKLLTSIRDSLNEALSAHGAVATDLNDGKQVTPAAVAKATEATAAVKELELEWKTMVDQTLADHEGRITALEGKDKVPTLASVPPAEPAPEPKVEPDVVIVEPNKPDQTVVAPPAQPVDVRYINPKTWGGMAWVMAAFGFIIFGLIALTIQGGFFPGVPAPMQWVRWLTLIMFPVFGLFAGGALGALYEESKQSETTVA